MSASHFSYVSTMFDDHKLNEQIEKEIQFNIPEHTISSTTSLSTTRNELEKISIYDIIKNQSSTNRDISSSVVMENSDRSEVSYY